MWGNKVSLVEQIKGGISQRIIGALEKAKGEARSSLILLFIIEKYRGKNTWRFLNQCGDAYD